MSDIHKINVSLLKSYKTDFNSEQSNFSNVTYNTFSSCYIRRCNDPYISKMSSNLDTLYSRIHKGYSNINTWWSDYLKNVEGLEQSLSNNGKGGYIDETSVRNYVISKLSNLADIALDLPTLTKKNITIKNTVKFSANQVTSTMSHFSDLSTGNMAISSIKTGQALISRKVASKQQKYANLFSSIKGAFQGSGFSSLTSGISNFFGKAKDDIIGNYKQQEELMNSYMGVLVNPNSTEEESLQAILSCFGDTELGTASKISLAEHFCNIRATSGMDKIAVFDYLIQTGTLSETEKLGIYEFLKNDKSITNDEMIQISSYFATSCGLSDENTWEILNYTLDELYQMRGMPVEYKISEFMSFAEAMGYTEDQKKDCVKFIVYNDNSAEALLYYFQIFDIPEEEQNKEIEKFYKANGITISYEDNSFQTFEGDIDEDLKNIMMLYASDRCDKESYQEYLRTKGLHDNGWGDLLRYYRDKNYEPSFLERAQATFVNGFMSFGEGILGIGEKFWDVITYAGSKVYQFSSSAILSMSNDYTFAEVWDAYDQTAGKETQKSIAKEHVTDFFNDNFYNTQYGQYITETGYASNVVRGFANGAAGVLGNLTLAMATGGSSVFIAGVSGFGSGLEDYYASGGTDEGKAFLAGSLSGGIDAFSYWTGQKINNFNPFKTTVKDGVKQTFKHTFKDTVKNAALHVGLDSVDAFASSFMQTSAKAVWATGAYDENGTWHEFTDEDNYKTRFWSIFDEQGGWSAVGQNVLLGAGFSAFSEMSGIAKHFRKDEVIDVKYLDDVYTNPYYKSANISEADIDNAKKLLSEYDNLKKIQDSAEYKQYLDENNKGYAHEFNQDFDTLDSKMSSIQKQMADLKAKGIDFDEIGKNAEVSSKNIINSEDITALMADAGMADYHINWTPSDLANLLHKNFDNFFGRDVVDSVVKTIHNIDSVEWPSFLKSRGLGDNILGFVDGANELYLPSNANMHTAFHESLHKFSELTGKHIEYNGEMYKVTGIREIFSDGTNTNWANETLTEHLASKYYDGKKYQSMYGINNIDLWDRLDETMSKIYGSDSNTLLRIYLENDTSFLRNYFDNYAKGATYDQFASFLLDSHWKKSSYEGASNIISNIEKSIKKNSSAFAKLKSIFKLNDGGFVDLDAINSVTTSIKSKAASLMDNLKKVKEADGISLRKLKKAKKYDDIYQIYGQEAYLKNTPSRYLKKDMNSLVKDNRFYELYEKYGEANYKKYIKQMQKVDVQYELGLKPGFLNYATLDNIGQKMKLVATKSAFAVSTIGTCMPLLLTGMFVVEGTSTSREASEKFADEFAEYNAEIEKYAEYINGLGLNDLEIIIKVIYDMYSNVSYRDGSSMYDTYGSQRLHLYYNGYGVCRNMADDFSARLNAINPDYDACNLAVFIYGAELNDIEVKVDTVNETVIGGESTNSSTEANTNFFNDYLQGISGNHMVSCIYLKSEDVYLIVDPTNPSIGVIKDGEIYMLSDLQPDGIEVKPYGNLISGIDQYSDYRERAKKSGSQDVDIEALKKKYGIDAQNEALEFVKKNTTTDHYNTKVD